MNVLIKKFGVEMEVKNTGIEFDIRTKDGHLGDMILNKTGLTWCEGRTSTQKGIKKTWEEVIRFFNED